MKTLIRTAHRTTSDKRDSPSAISVDELYLMDIRRCRLLTGEEEETLMDRYRQGTEILDAMAGCCKVGGAIPQAPLWNKDDHIVSYIAINARSLVIKAHLPLVFKVAGQRRRNGTGLAELISAGVDGLYDALKRFDLAANRRFSAYARLWVTARITSYLRERDRLMHVPDHIHKDVARLRKIHMEMRERTDRAPSPQEISDKTGWGISKIGRLTAWMEKDAVSLDRPIGDGSSTWADFIPDQDGIVPGHDAASPPDVSADATLLSEQVRRVISTLTGREQQVLILRFGLEDGRSRTLGEVGDIFSLGRERIRQIEAKALRKLRHPSRSASLRGFL